MSDVAKCTTHADYLARYRKAFDVHHASWFYKTARSILNNDPFSSSSSYWWMWREVARMLDGTHEMIMPEYPMWHWIHNDPRFYYFAPVVSKQDRSMVSYIPDAEYGLADRRVMTKIGRFLTANFPGRVLPERVAQISNAYKIQSNPPALRIARTQDEIIGIYKFGDGLRSCMAAKPWRLIDSPIASYNDERGSLPIGVAYVNALGTGMPIARCVVRFDRDPPEFGRIYGNEWAMRAALGREGFRASIDALHGCELVGRKKAGHNNVLLVPYLDAPSRYALINLPTGRVFACTGSEISANALLKRYDLGTVHNGDNLLLETGQYGVIQHDAIVHFNSKEPLEILTLGPCECCRKQFPSRVLTEVVGGGRACSGCLRHSYVSAVTNTDGASAFVHIQDERLISVTCVESYVVAPLQPEAVFDVVWSTWSDRYIRASLSVRSAVLNSDIERSECTPYRHLKHGLKNTSVLFQYAPLGFLLQASSAHLIAEYDPNYPLLLVGVWMDDAVDSVFNALARAQGDENGEAAEPKTPWGSRLRRFPDWICAASDAIDDEEFGSGRDRHGIQQRLYELANCEISDLPLVDAHRRAKALFDHLGDAGGAQAA